MAYNFVRNCFHVNFLHQVVLVSLLCLAVITTLLTQHSYHTDRLPTNMAAAKFKHHNTHTKQSTYSN